MEVYREGQASATIVDVLNEDCWRMILDMIHIKDIIRSERVSKQWQNVVLQYLQGTHFSIEGPSDKIENNTLKFRTVELKDGKDEFCENYYLQALEQITGKWGQCIRKADCYNYNEASIEVLARNCPNLRHIRFCNIKDDVLTLGSPRHSFKKLTSLTFESYYHVTDETIRIWLDKVAIEDLTISKTSIVTGLFLLDIQLTNLRTLSFSRCSALKFKYLLSAADRLTSLKKLEIFHTTEEISKNMHLLLDKLPNLEDLSLKVWYPKVLFGLELPEAISRLKLKRLDLSFNTNVNDEWMEIISRGCGRLLQELNLERSLEVTERGVLAVCRAAGPALRRLSVGSNREICDHHVVAFIDALPNLEMLDLSYGMGITENLVDKAGEATRGRPSLRLNVESTMVEGFHEDRYPWLILDFGEE